MNDVFWRQFVALFWKNWIVLSKHPLLNILRCLVLPIAYGVFLATAQLFLNRPNNFGIGHPIPVYALQSRFSAPSLLLWVDATDGTSSPSPAQIISRMTSSFSTTQRQHVKQVSDPSDIPLFCPENFNWLSECFGAIVFYDVPANGGASRPINYTIQADAGLGHIDVQRHTSDYEEKAIIELQTGTQLQTPLEWPFTQESNSQQYTSIRLGYIGAINSILILALFICFIGIAYQLPGGVAGERANGLTAHMKAMGLLDSARILSCHVSISLAYLPAWIVVGLLWHYLIFSSSNAGLVLVVHLLLGLTLASWSFFVAAPFGKSPQLAAVVTTFLSILFAVLALVFKQATNGTAFIFTLLFPPGFYVFAIRCIGGWERHQLAANVVHPDPDSQLTLLLQIIAAIIDVFLWPCIAVLLERYLYDARTFHGKSALDAEDFPIPPDTAISVRNLHKVFKKSHFSSRSTITAIDDLSFDVPKRGIFVLLGSNGAGKSTVLSIIGGLSSSNSGKVIFEDGRQRPPRGTIGIVPQKNVLFPDLSCIQNLRVWRAVKWSTNTDKREDLIQLLRDCDLEGKAHFNASVLSGGQKRKLQLAAGLVGGSNVVVLYYWRTLISVRDSRTIILTTHFLDEADLLADQIAILVAPGRLMAQGSPVMLKHDYGRGYSLQVTFNPNVDRGNDACQSELCDQVRAHANLAQVHHVSPLHIVYLLNTKNVDIVARLLFVLEEEKSKYNISSLDIFGTSIEDAFLGFMEREGEPLPEGNLVQAPEKATEERNDLKGPKPVFQLSQGRPTSLFRQAFTVLYKRLLIFRRSWLSPFLTVLVAVAGSTVPTIFINRDDQTCTSLVQEVTPVSLYLPTSIASSFSLPLVLESPPGIISTLGSSTSNVMVIDVPDNATFFQEIFTNYSDLPMGGVSFDLETGSSVVAWEASPPGMMGPMMLNLVTNVLYNRALNMSSAHGRSSSTIINANYQPFPPPDGRSLNALKWAAFFGAAMSVFPAFFTLYVSRERQSSVQAMQFSNGLTNPLGLWLGHLMFDTVWTIFLSTLIVIVFSTISRGFHGIGFFWLVLVLYGISGALFAYCTTLFVTSPLAAFAIVAGYQIIMFCLYFAGYLLVLTFGKTSQANKMISIINWTLSLASPVASVLRAALISLNLFSLLCDGTTVVTTLSLGQLQRFGGPILYLILYSCILLAVLFLAASGSLLPRRSPGQHNELTLPNDVAAEAEAAGQLDKLLQVAQVSRQFQGKWAVDNVSFGVSRDSIFALLGPNGAGKTTTFNMICGNTLPDTGNVFIAGTSVVRYPRIARLSLGICPQFTAVDAQMTVREHLIIYGRFKGLRGQVLVENVKAILSATELQLYADRLANKLSGGNQRKLSLAIALIGNPPVLLIDEFSTGIDARMKRDMWNTLRQAAAGKAVIMTTHSMEEASALADKVGILATRLLAIGSTKSLCDRHAVYEVHFTHRTREDLVKIQDIMAQIPGSRMMDDVATRFEVPIEPSPSTNRGLSLSQLFNILTRSGGSDGDIEITVGRATLESVFLKVIRENGVQEENNETHRRRRFFSL